MMEAFCNEDSIYNRLNPYDYNEKMIELEDQLKVEFWRVVETLLTERRKQVIRLYADGYTQSETAKMLGVNQSSITKSFNGNRAYSNKNPKDINQQNTNQQNNKNKSYGGSRRKLQRIISDDSKIQEILTKMAEVRGEKW
jgi:predicted transcriptional regulator